MDRMSILLIVIIVLLLAQMQNVCAIIFLR